MDLLSHQLNRVLSTLMTLTAYRSYSEPERYNA